MVAFFGSVFPNIFPFNLRLEIIFLLQESFLELLIFVFVVSIYLVSFFEDSYHSYIRSSLLILLSVPCSQILSLHFWLIHNFFPFPYSVSVEQHPLCLSFVFLLILSFLKFFFCFYFFCKLCYFSFNVPFLQLSHSWVFLILIAVILS